MARPPASSMPATAKSSAPNDDVLLLPHRDDLI